MHVLDYQNFVMGNAHDSYKVFGAHKTVVDGVEGFVFRLYAPHAKAVELVGDFNSWQGYKNKMTKVDINGVWETFVPNIKDYQNYKYHILTAQNMWVDKIDPFSFFSELRPKNASRTYDIDGFIWHDEKFISKRNLNLNKAMNIYELHLGSWVKANDRFFSYSELAEKLVEYLNNKGYTHVEILPISEHPLDMSWGYQCSGYFSATSRYGNPKQLMSLIDVLHQNGIGVIFDFVPVHFVKDDFGLINFDGAPIFESDDENKRYNSWGSINFDYSKGPVKSFLTSAANYYCEYFHVDGIRFDAVSNIIYPEGNKSLGEREEGIAFIKHLNGMLDFYQPKVMRIAEDSSDYQGVTKSQKQGGLGFHYKWDLGWMNDTLKYYETDPIFRKYEHHKITFSMFYFYNEQFLLPLSHDEVVHGKKSIVDKMWGSYEQKFQQARNLYIYMLTHPGKKLNFMGNEIAHFREWHEHTSMDWFLLEYPQHRKFLDFIVELNKVYTKNPALYKYDYDESKYKWLIVDNKDQSIFAYYREAGKNIIVTILNMTPVYYESYHVPVPYEGKYKEIINSDLEKFGGYTNRDKYIKYASFNYGAEQNFIDLTLPSFGAIVLKFERK